jgi:hypothetical protein
MGRSGSTLLFEILAAHPELAWFTQYLNRAPGWPSLAMISRLGGLGPAFRRRPPGSEAGAAWLERLRIRPAEAYGVWRHYCGERFLRDFLTGTTATEEERERLLWFASRVVRYQGRPRLASKITGPARIEYLNSIFEDALFVHLVRDGRAVAESLLRRNFWRNSSRMRKPAWDNALSDEELTRWRELGADPLALAAIQWRAAVLGARRDAASFVPDRYLEIRYEDFLADPHELLDRITDFCDLQRSPEVHRFLDRNVRLRDATGRWRDAVTPAQMGLLDELIGDTLRELGY